MSMDDAKPDPSVDPDMLEATKEDQDLAFALQMSVQDNAKDSANQTEMREVLGDQSFLSSILGSLPGVDPNDPSVKDLLASLQGQSEQKEDEDKPPK
ncbi:26S proteasome non-ATPase regulatory subunit 4 homolog [Macadamia integrifolia]|uniref:26S proteasome non-ATPase regulatory subunit 4 homolog n=1 Tax=Macadamia integrifolia TaxID=60698 RepID=UPI001C52B55F|nr:26S proteasome non-ATPase regulatory subunit 4 homolog [Macadamia integrifolia]